MPWLWRVVRSPLLTEVALAVLNAVASREKRRRTAR